VKGGLVQSVQTRLVRHAKTLGVDPNLVLTRYAAERLLYRLSRSPDAERFVLKGALMLLVWLGESIRPTRDADLLGFGRSIPNRCARPSQGSALSMSNPTVCASTPRPSRSPPYGSRTPTAASA
jgi:hypothetical protein